MVKFGRINLADFVNSAGRFQSGPAMRAFVDAFEEIYDLESDSLDNGHSVMAPGLSVEITETSKSAEKRCYTFVIGMNHGTPDEGSVRYFLTHHLATREIEWHK